MIPKYQINFRSYIMKNLITISSLKMVCVALIVTLSIVGCGESDPENKGNHLPDVNIIENDTTIRVGATINLSAVILDVDGDELTYKWTFSEKPTGSKASLTNSDTLVKETSFTADVEGKYIVNLTAKDALDAVGSDSVTIVATNSCTSSVEVDKDITTDTVFDEDKCYNITRGILNISNNALLTIKPGAIVIFEENGGINVSDDGALNAVGTAKKPILFTGKQKINPGYWRSIAFRGSDDPRNEIDYAIVEYAGAGYGYGSLHLVGNYGTDNRLKLSNTTFKHSASHGFCLEKRSKMDKFENITSTKNTLSAGRVDMSILDKLDSASNFTGNLGDDYITVEYGDVFTDATWKSLSVPIYFKRALTIHDEALLTLSAGSHLVFDNGIKVTTGPLGALKAVGTAKEPILFTGKQKTAGFWEGITIGSDNTNNIMEYVTVEYASNALYLNTHFSNSTRARASVKNSTFRHNSNYGIYIYYDSVANYNQDIDSVNTFENNTNGNINRRN
jgi:hypothetical protein